MNVIYSIFREDIEFLEEALVLDSRGKSTATALDISIDSIENAETDLHKRFPFILRKRGVETRIILADQPSGRDEALIRNIARAYQWFEQIKAGATFAEIAGAEDTSKRRVQQVIPLAFLAPDIVRDVLDGKQPLGLTSDWCLRHQIPSNWDQQRAVLATL